jgi:hypothetical protein
MLGQDHKELLTRTMQGAVTSPTALQVLLNKAQQGAWGDLPNGASLNDAIEIAVGNADGQGWLRPLVEQLIKDYPKRPEFNDVLKAIAEAEKKGGLFQKMGLGDPRNQIRSLWNSVTGALLSLAGFLLSLRFLAGLAACLIVVMAILTFVPDDEIAIKTVDEGGARVKFVNLQYESRKGAPTGQPKLLQSPDQEGFYRIQQRDLAEPAQIGLILDEANLPPRWAGNDKVPVLQVVKVNYAEDGVPVWNKTRKLFLFVKLQ